jgi:hypothetical protein
MFPIKKMSTASDFLKQLCLYQDLDTNIKISFDNLDNSKKIKPIANSFDLLTFDKKTEKSVFIKFAENYYIKKYYFGIAGKLPTLQDSYIFNKNSIVEHKYFINIFFLQNDKFLINNILEEHLLFPYDNARLEKIILSINEESKISINFFFP